MGDSWARVLCAWIFPAFEPVVLNQCALVRLRDNCEPLQVSSQHSE